MSTVLAFFPFLVLQFLSHLVSLLREVVTGRNSWRLRGEGGPGTGGGRGEGEGGGVYSSLRSFPVHNASCHTFSHLV